MVGITVYRGYTIEILEVDLAPPEIGSAEPVRKFKRLFGVRANVKTLAGKSEFAKVDINGNAVTHQFAIRFTNIPFDTRHLVRDARGSLYRILRVEDVDLQNREMKIHCASMGDETVEGAR